VEPREYERLAASEDAMWWFRGLHANLIAAWRAAGGGGNVFLDAGCGTGGFLKRLRAEAPGAFRCGVDLDMGAARMAQARSGAAIAAGSVTQLPFAAGAFDVVFSADVLCHRGVGANAALAEFRRCLKPGGVIVLNLPAYRWLFSAHDRAVDNVRRFGADEVRDALAAAGFARVRVAHWNSILFPLMVLRRKILPGGASDVEILPAPVERFFFACVAVEAALAAGGWALPFGGSILASAVKP